jgi:hypothetical protein
MSGVGTPGLTKSFPPPPLYFRLWNKALYVPAPVQQLTLPIYGITKVGAQVISLGKFEANNEYVLELGQMILERGFEVWLGDVGKTSDNQYEIVNAQPLVRPAPATDHSPSSEAQ